MSRFVYHKIAGISPWWKLGSGTALSVLSISTPVKITVKCEKPTQTFSTIPGSEYFQMTACVWYLRQSLADHCCGCGGLAILLDCVCNSFYGDSSPHTYIRVRAAESGSWRSRNLRSRLADKLRVRVYETHPSIHPSIIRSLEKLEKLRLTGS